jgi:thiamine kinase-like enzyme
MEEHLLIALKKKVPALADVTNISILKGGLTNVNYRLDTPSDKYVIRISDKKTSLLGIERENERINAQRAYLAGVGAEIIDFLSEEDILVIKWIDAKTLHKDDIKSQPEMLERIARAVRALHKGPKFQQDFYFPSVRKKYLEIVQENNFFIPDNYLRLEPLVVELESLLKVHPEPLAPCNNDLLAENFLDDGTKIWIIDYEYSGQNEPSFEIGNMASELALNREQLVTLCNVYWEENLDHKVWRALAWSVIARFGWVMWASIQEGVSKISFDFRGWGLGKWNSVLLELEGDQYQEIFKNLIDFNQ